MKIEWKEIIGYKGEYLISNTGLVKSLKNNKEKLLKQSNHKFGYLYVTLSKHSKTKKILVHRLVALYFISNDENLNCINHIDENKKNNNVTNLEWITSGDNNRYSCVNRKEKPMVIVEQLKDGIVINEFESCPEASRITGIDKSSIIRVTNNIRKSCGGFTFRKKEPTGQGGKVYEN